MYCLTRERAPNISDDLQSSRTMLKHFLGQAGQGLNRSKWSSFKASVQSLQNVCMSAWDGKEEVMSPQDRFAPPTAPKGLPSSDVTFLRKLCNCCTHIALPPRR